MRIAVTGGAGFIGSHLVDKLVECGHQVLVFDNLSDGDLANLACVRDRIAFKRVDVRDRDRCMRELGKWQPEAVAHLAAVASVAMSIEQPGYVHDVNLGGTANILLASQQAGARRLVFASSAAVYGPEPALPSSESHAVDPISPYAAQKASGELLAYATRLTWGLETVSLRFFNVFGPRQRSDSPYSGVISIFLESLLTRGRAAITGDGEQSRDFIYVEDVVRAVMSALLGPDPGPGPFNVGRGEAISVRQLYRMLAARLGANDEPCFVERRSCDVRHSRARIARLVKELGVRPAVTIDEGLSRLVSSRQAAMGVLPRVSPWVCEHDDGVVS
jgi:UDP-glucose 4-epimerase